MRFAILEVDSERGLPYSRRRVKCVLRRSGKVAGLVGGKFEPRTCNRAQALAGTSSNWATAREELVATDLVHSNL